MVNVRVVDGPISPAPRDRLLVASQMQALSGVGEIVGEAGEGGILGGTSPDFLRESRILRASRQVLSVLAGVDRFHAARPRRPEGGATDGFFVGPAGPLLSLQIEGVPGRSPR